MTRYFSVAFLAVAFFSLIYMKPATSAIEDLMMHDVEESSPEATTVGGPLPGSLYKCTKTLFSDNPDMIDLIRMKNPGYVDNSYVCLSFTKNSNRVSTGTLKGGSTKVDDPEPGTYQINVANKTIRIHYANSDYPDETYGYEVKPGSDFISALTLKNEKKPNQPYRFVLVTE